MGVDGSVFGNSLVLVERVDDSALLSGCGVGVISGGADTGIRACRGSMSMICGKGCAGCVVSTSGGEGGDTTRGAVGITTVEVRICDGNSSLLARPNRPPTTNAIGPNTRRILVVNNASKRNGLRLGNNG